MPPRSKFTREEMVSAALDITREEGIDALTARALAGRLGSSARPIFTVFDSMDEVSAAVVDAAKAEYSEYVERGLGEAIAFKGVGTAYIRFAAERSKLFMLLFMRERGDVPSAETVIGAIDDNWEKILGSIVDAYGLDRDVAKRLYRHLWIYTHGIATLIATNVCTFTPDEISQMLTAVFASLMAKIKTGDEI